MVGKNDLRTRLLEMVGALNQAPIQEAHDAGFVVIRSDQFQNMQLDLMNLRTLVDGLSNLPDGASSETGGATRNYELNLNQLRLVGFEGA